MNKLKLLSAVLMVLLSTPIWLYLQYKIMVLVNATELMWFLFWIYLPVSVVATTIIQLKTSDK